MGRIRKFNLAADIVLLRFESQYELASTFLRVQEHYESSRFNRRMFSLEQYMDWYADQFGAFTYFEDWDGFNVPSVAFTPFYEGRFDPLLRKERRLLDLFRKRRSPFYVIGVASPQSVKHEIAHALFSTRQAYRTAVTNAMRGFNTSRLEKQLAAQGYCARVLPDEVQAYLIGPAGVLGSDDRRLDPLCRTLRALFRKHAAGLSIPHAYDFSRGRTSRRRS